MFSKREQPWNTGSLRNVLIALRILLGVLVAIAIAAAVAPMLVIADLAGEEATGPNAVAEALGYRGVAAAGT